MHRASAALRMRRQIRGRGIVGGRGRRWRQCRHRPLHCAILGLPVLRWNVIQHRREPALGFRHAPVLARDQVEDYAARKNWSVAEAERWLAPVLNYIPAQDRQAQDRAVQRAMPTLAPSSATPANDAAATDMAAHPQGCDCAVHLAWRRKAVGAG